MKVLKIIIQIVDITYQYNMKHLWSHTCMFKYFVQNLLIFFLKKIRLADNVTMNIVLTDRKYLS